MISPTAVVLAVVLPLLLCLIMLLGVLLLRGRHLRAFDAIDQQRLHDKCATLEKRLAAFPKAWDGHGEDLHLSREDRRHTQGDLSPYYVVHSPACHLA
jgi:hypothetical protein